MIRLFKNLVRRFAISDMLIQKQKIRENPYVGTEWEVKGTFA